MDTSNDPLASFDSPEEYKEHLQTIGTSQDTTKMNSFEKYNNDDLPLFGEKKK